ncbi:MAG TPA: hypothetical protein VHO25_21385, partial [Polyangiaceae bacterium]|nr:hypothetical protein [Polyangiaceae bacterium]
ALSLCLGVCLATACAGSGGSDNPTTTPGGGGSTGSNTGGSGASGGATGGTSTAGQVSSAGSAGDLGAAGNTANAGTGGATAGSGGSDGSSGSAGAGAGGEGGSAGASNGGSGGTAQGGAATAPPGTPPDYTLLFEETFAAPAAMDRFLYGNPGDWAHVAMDGGYAEWTGFSYDPPYRSPFSMAIIKDQKFSSLVLEVEVMQTSMTGGHRDFCVMWNIVDASHFYYAHIGAAHDGVSHNIHIVNMADRAAITTTYDDGFDWGTDEWRKIRLVRDAVSGSIEIYGGDATTPMLTANDTTFTDGYVGVGAFDDTGRVRNLRIWAASSTQEAATFLEPLAP